MGIKFGDTAKSYYEKNKNKINLPEWAEAYIYEIFEKIYENNCTDKVLTLAEEKVEYIKQRNFRQGNLDL